jgi:hypothetical protein
VVFLAFFISLVLNVDPLGCGCDCGLRWYNSRVPTPFYHLFVAETLLTANTLPATLQTFLMAYRPAFFFGHVAPDVQVVSGQRREETHFFRLPSQENLGPPWSQFELAYPRLAQGGGHSPQLAAFLAGYGCHLRADWLWVTEVFEPFFGLQAGWDTLRERLYLHNVLRSYLDRQVLERIRDLSRHALEQVALNGWLPFVQDTHLAAWCHLLTDQLVPGAKIQTVEVFASRQGIPPGAYYDLLNSEQAVEETIFSHLSHQRLDIYLDELLVDNVAFLQDYLGEPD